MAQNDLVRYLYRSALRVTNQLVAYMENPNCQDVAQKHLLDLCKQLSHPPIIPYNPTFLQLFNNNMLATKRKIDLLYSKLSENNFKLANSAMTVSVPDGPEHTGAHDFSHITIESPPKFQSDDMVSTSPLFSTSVLEHDFYRKLVLEKLLKTELPMSDVTQCDDIKPILESNESVPTFSIVCIKNIVHNQFRQIMSGSNDEIVNRRISDYFTFIRWARKIGISVYDSPSNFVIMNQYKLITTGKILTTQSGTSLLADIVIEDLNDDLSTSYRIESKSVIVYIPSEVKPKILTFKKPSSVIKTTTYSESSSIPLHIIQKDSSSIRFEVECKLRSFKGNEILVLKSGVVHLRFPPDLFFVPEKEVSENHEVNDNSEPISKLTSASMQEAPIWKKSDPESLTPDPL